MWAYVHRYRWYALGFVAALVLLIYFSAKLYPVISEKNTINIGYIGSYTISNLPPDALSLATKTLIDVDETGKPQPSLASHWTISEDAKTYVVFLKDNLKWHDGTNVNAKDIQIAISGVGIQALNNKAIEFKLPNPIASFLLALDKPVFKTKSFYGTGEYRIVKIDEVDSVVKKISLVSSDPNLPRVNLKFYPTEAQALTAFEIGEIKKGYFGNATELENFPNITLTKNVDKNEIVTIFFNNSDKIFSGKELRQAAIHALNRSEFDGQSATGPISPNNWTYNSAIKKYEYNTGKAKELISKSNYGNEKITLSYIPSTRELAARIKKDWQAVGLNVEIKEENQLPKNYQAFLTISKLSPDPDQYDLWHSSQKQTNITGYKNVKIDKLLEDARSTQDEKQRASLYADFQRFLVEDAPAAFLYYPYKYEAAYKNSESLISKLPK